MYDRHESGVLRSIDRHGLDESEPFYEDDGEFRVELPDDPRARVQDFPVDDERFGAILQEFVNRIELELQRVFECDTDE